MKFIIDIRTLCFEVETPGGSHLLSRLSKVTLEFFLFWRGNPREGFHLYSRFLKVKDGPFTYCFCSTPFFKIMLFVFKKTLVVQCLCKNMLFCV